MSNATKEIRLQKPPATILVNDKIVEAWWRQLSPDKKVELFASNYVIRLEGQVG
jgi:hypothetical protein